MTPMTRSMALLAAGMLAVIGVSAQPAPWYLWKSKLSGKTFCAQTSPGEGWQKAGGPFKDSRCKNPVVPPHNRSGQRTPVTAAERQPD